MHPNAPLQTDLCLKYLEYLGPAPSPRSDRSLIILIHGRGSNEADLFDFAPLLDERLIVLSVRAPLEQGKIAFAWFKTQYLETGPIHDVGQAEEAIQMFIQFLGEAQKKYGIAAKKTVLFGFSQGAILSQAIAIQHSQLVGGVVALSGRILPEHTLKPEFSEGLKDFPIFLSHGKYDDVLKIDYAHSSRKLLSALDFDLTYKEYPSGHEISDQNFSDAKQWLFNWLNLQNR